MAPQDKEEEKLRPYRSPLVLNEHVDFFTEPSNNECI